MRILRRGLPKTLRIAVIAGLLLGTVAAFYLASLYRQLQHSFNEQEQFIPTRIYSDLSRITPALPKSQVLARLARLNYTTETSPDHLTLHLALHAIDYPTYLLPDGSPGASWGGQPVALIFDQESQDARLESITVGGAEVAELDLEPELIGTLSATGAEAGHEIRQVLKFSEVPAQIWQAIIAVEDQHFMEHAGFDPRGVLRAMWVNLKTLSLAQGGSTLTQQLVKNLMARHNKNIFRKINELFLAIILEARFSKDEILERYLNEVYLGQVGALEIHGVAEGARHFFGKRVEDLNLAEIALMAAVIRGPGFYSPYRYLKRAIDRQHLVLKKMVEVGLIADEEANDALQMPIRLAPPQTQLSKAPYFSDFVKAELVRLLKDKVSESDILSSGFRVYTTLDPWTNAIAQKTVAAQIDSLEKRLKIKTPLRLEGALASVDPSSGLIRALVGGRSYGESNFNRILNMKRQVGSAFKPVVYLAAYSGGKDSKDNPYSPAYPVKDAPWKLVYDQGRQTWEPRNYERDYLGWITLRTALAHSINTVAAHLGVLVGIPAITDTARKLGITSELPQVPSLALGVAELSPIELVRAYATIANHGQRVELTAIRGINRNDGSVMERLSAHSEAGVDPAAADLLTDTLQSVFTEGTAHEAIRMGWDRPSAGKTGTTSNSRDAWFAGFTPQLTTVVWVGPDQDDAKSRQAKLTLTGATSALPIWIDFMKQALEGDPPRNFPESPLLSTEKIDRHTGKKASLFCSDSQTIRDHLITAREPSTSSCEADWPSFEPITHIP